VVIGAIPEITAVAVIVAPVAGVVPSISATVTVAGVLGWTGADGRIDMVTAEASAIPRLNDVVTVPVFVMVAVQAPAGALGRWYMMRVPH